MPLSLPKAAPQAVRRFEELIPEDDRVRARTMFGQPCAFVNGNMFFGVFGGHLFVRLSEEDRAEAARTPGFTAFEPMPGRAMREYRVLPATVLGNRERARQWAARSLRFASSLPPKKGLRAAK